MTVMVGTPRVLMHLEAETEACICPRLARCGGIDTILGDCPEHGFTCGPQTRFHTHAQQVDRVNQGRHIA